MIGDEMSEQTLDVLWRDFVAAAAVIAVCTAIGGMVQWWL
jgi:hypothetical protein